MELLDRVALIVTPRRRCLEWVSALPEADRRYTIDDAKSLRTVCLVHGGDDEPDVDDLTDEYFDTLFEEWLGGWTTDESLWPSNRTAHVFRDWFQVECIDYVIDVDSHEPLLVSERVLTHCANCDSLLTEGATVFVGLARDSSRRLTADEAAAAEQELAGALEAGTVAPEPLTLVQRCCSAECAAEVESAYTAALASRNRVPDE